MTTFSDEIGISGGAAVAVVLSTAVMYVLLVLLLRRWGRAFLVRPSLRGLAVAMVLGPLVGRTFLLIDPTLTTGILSMATLLVTASLLRRVGLGDRRSEGAVPLVVAGEVRAEALARHRLAEQDLWVRLRELGHGSLDGVALALLEPGGQISVIRAGARLDRRVVADVTDAETLPSELFG